MNQRHLLRTLIRLLPLCGLLLMTLWPRAAGADTASPPPAPAHFGDLLRGLTLTPTPVALMAGSDEGISLVQTGTFTYTVQPRDTPWSLAVDLGRNIESLACATRPEASDPYDFRAGEVLTIPALDTICHQVADGETLPAIADQYGVTVDSIVEITWNELPSANATLVPGRHLLVYQQEGVEQPVIALPRGSLPRWDTSMLPFDPANPPAGTHVTPDGFYWQGTWPYGDGHFIWPVKGGWISQGFVASKHRAVDIAVAFGSPVMAADNGTVVLAGWNNQGYGYRVVIDHNNDYLTLYAHLSNFYVKAGDVVDKGQVIGAIGSTGNSTGPHLHFELRDFGRLVDPLGMLGK